MHIPQTAPPDRPKLRHGLAAERHRDGNLVLHDPFGIGDAVVVSPLAVEVAGRFDGEATPAEIAAAVKAEFPAVQASVEDVTRLAAALDEASLLDSPRLRARFAGPVRRPWCLEPFSRRPDELRRQLAHLFTAPGGPGLPATSPPRPRSERLRAVLAPHMDYGRGGVTYGHAFKELVENSDARVFVIVATSHYSPARFTLSRQHFDTPLGLVETDTDYVDRIAGEYGDGLFDDPLAHVPEHSIELEVALLRYLLADQRPFKDGRGSEGEPIGGSPFPIVRGFEGEPTGGSPFRIVPLLVGSVHDYVRTNGNPPEGDELSRMVRALRAAEEACSEPVCYVISGDLAHIGPKFGDKRKAEGPWLDESRMKDESILSALEAGCPNAFFDGIAAEQNARRVCGLSPTWLALDVLRPKSGKVLHYQQYVHPQGRESVSFAAAAFYG